MKELTAKKILLLVLFCLTTATAVEAYANENCCRPIYECACNPLFCGTYTGQLHAGIAPIIWTKRGEVDLLSCPANPLNPVYQLAAHFPKFKTLYKLPWTFGGILGYAWTDNVEMYLEFNYLQATQKHHNTTGYSFVFPNVVPTQSLLIKLNRYSLVDGYVGIRYYWDRFCNWVSPFIGLKVGFTSHFNVNAAFSVNGTPVILVPAAGINSCVPSAASSTANNHFFNRNTVVAGGINAGIDVCFCDGWSFMATGEFVVSCAPRLRAPSVFATPLPGPTFATNLITGGIGSELRFPVTFGIKRIF
jgi:hypothetical protein